MGTIDYSVRPNKAAQRQLVFGALSTFAGPDGLADCEYIGFGSLWFEDFVVAHRDLGINRLTSLESSAVLAKRAAYNAPYRCIDVVSEYSTTFLREKRWDARRVLWLDYVDPPGEATRDDIGLFAERAMADSYLIITVNAKPGCVAKTPERRAEYLRGLFGDAVEHDIDPGTLADEKYAESLARILDEYVQLRGRNGARPGAFLKLGCVEYADGARMLTGVWAYVDPGEVGLREVERLHQRCPLLRQPVVRLQLPVLTPKERRALDRLLPGGTVADARSALGFALDGEAFRRYREVYKLYPSYARVAASG